jgi:hypothetical protein
MMKVGKEWIEAPERTIEEIGQVILMYLERIERHLKNWERLPREIAELDRRIRRLEMQDKLRRR